MPWTIYESPFGPLTLVAGRAGLREVHFPERKRRLEPVDHDPDGLTIEGGFANCSAGLSSGRTTIDGSGAAPAGPLFVHSGNGPLTLRHLILQNAAGGIQSVVAGPLTLADVIVYSNHADYGGGLFVSGNDIFRPKLNLIGSSINSNSATVNGGGLYLNRVDVSITGGSNILGNTAQGGAGTSDGGGIYAIDSNILFNDHSVASIPTIGSNYAQRNGGGVYFSNTVSAFFFCSGVMVS